VEEAITWMVALGVPAVILQPAYRRALAAIATDVLRLTGQSFRIRDVAVQQPLHIAMFLALCLATRDVSRAQKARAIAIGVPVLAVLGLIDVVGVAVAFNHLRHQGADVFDTAPRALAALIDGLPWIAAPWLWVTLLVPSRTFQRARAPRA
jgi:exosortase/archaeosortase